MAKKASKGTTADVKVEDKLKALYELQCVDNKIFEIHTLRGELPLEVQDLEDELAGLETRIQKIEGDIKNLEQEVAHKNSEIKNSESLIKKYNEQQMNVRNNREYESISKELEFQALEIELAEKRIKEYTTAIQQKKDSIEKSKKAFEDRGKDLEAKKGELNKIIDETAKEEKKLEKRATTIAATVEERLLKAYRRIKDNSQNRIAVASVERDACSGCFNRIPPQRQVDVQNRKKLIVCEYCGRILVDPMLAEEINCA
ncbi:MAG: C4-type zinc ribbon domain-containing protein [Salinivirgaceae bacterium]|jgi:predicted  nucleic acid-binding Zn-ribbon protein|nr:C4-type zinc ribbon domain-containing protein [Salinivirgaceae bacterium]